MEFVMVRMMESPRDSSEAVALRLALSLHEGIDIGGHGMIKMAGSEPRRVSIFTHAGHEKGYYLYRYYTILYDETA